jgi:3beta-hydroxy-Delta5-steroid dehydrogenase / steroid Delta-isomerase
MGGQRISGGDETLPYTERFNDLYTETKVAAERFVLSQNGVQGMLTCSIRRAGSGAAATRPCSAGCSTACSPGT